MPVSRILRGFALAAGMVVSVPSFAGIVWRGGIDQASQGAAAFISSPQGKVAGLVYSLDPTATGWKLNRSSGVLQQMPAPFIGGYSPLRPASAYGIPTSAAKSAVIDVQTRVPIPGKSSYLPAQIIEPVSKGTLSRVLAKSSRLLPLIGTGLLIYDILEEAGYTVQNDGTIIKTVNDGSIVNGWGPCHGGWTTCSWEWNTSFQPGEVRILDFGGGRVYRYERKDCLVNQGSWGYVQVGDDAYSGMFPGSTPCNFYNVVVTRYTGPTTVIATDSEIIDLFNNKPEGVLIDAANQLPDHSDVIDVIAREIKDDSPDEEIRLFSPTGTVQVGDPITETHTLPDGSTKTITTTTTATAQGDEVKFERHQVTELKSPTGQVTETSKIASPITNPVDQSTPPQTGEDIECGLPGYPPCKIDETGTPDGGDDDGSDDFFGLLPTCLKEDWKTCIPELPEVNWAFTLPTGCGPIPLPAFERWGLGSIDICPYQPMIHDIMSMLWAAAGLFGAVSIVRRGSRSEES